MFISPIYASNQYNFGAKYTNPNGKTVEVSENAIEQAETMAYIRYTVNEAMKKCPEAILRNPAGGNIGGKKLYFTIDENGKCVITNEEIPTILYKGEIKGDRHSFSRRKADEIDAYKQCLGRKAHYSDENGSIRANGDGLKFAHVLSDGSVEITYPEWAPED